MLKPKEKAKNPLGFRSKNRNMKLILILKTNTVLKNIDKLRGMILDLKILRNSYLTYIEITIHKICYQWF